MSNRGRLAAECLLREFGISDIQDIDIRDLVYARGIILQEKPIKNSDGRIVFGSKDTIITVNSQIEYEGRKRFTIAHELGHFELHHNKNTHWADNAASLDYYKKGDQESEANEFATELLIPRGVFLRKIEKRRFTPTLLVELANYFKVSVIAVVFRYLDLGQHPICLFQCYNNKVQYWKKSNGLHLRIKDVTRLSPPENSVAREFFDEGITYKFDDVQEITKSVWFELGNYDRDDRFYECCIVTKKYNMTLSVVWTD